VAGYSRLIGADEEGAIARLRALRRDLIDPAIAESRGRIVKTTGDGILIEFASVVEAVRCAIEVQRRMISRNTDVPTDKRIEFRVGVHLGDVVVDGDDLMGDGVNIAARLEGMAEPGGICLSGDAYRQVKAKSISPRAIWGSSASSPQDYRRTSPCQSRAADFGPQKPTLSGADDWTRYEAGLRRTGLPE
jgi:class 3 adenylate cyclase